MVFAVSSIKFNSFYQAATVPQQPARLAADMASRMAAITHLACTSVWQAPLVSTALWHKHQCTACMPRL